MPILYRKRDRLKLRAISLTKLKNKLKELGYEFIREGGLRQEDEPSKWDKYIFYTNKKEGKHVRILCGFFTDNIIELCYYKEGTPAYWNDLIPDYRKQIWKDIMKNHIYPNNEWRERKNSKKKF